MVFSRVHMGHVSRHCRKHYPFMFHYKHLISPASVAAAAVAVRTIPFDRERDAPGMRQIGGAYRLVCWHSLFSFVDA